MVETITLTIPASIKCQIGGMLREQDRALIQRGADLLRNISKPAVLAPDWWHEVFPDRDDRADYIAFRQEWLAVRASYAEMWGDDADDITVWDRSMYLATGLRPQDVL